MFCMRFPDSALPFRLLREDKLAMNFRMRTEFSSEKRTPPKNGTRWAFKDEV